MGLGDVGCGWDDLSMKMPLPPTRKEKMKRMVPVAAAVVDVVVKVLLPICQSCIQCV